MFQKVLQGFLATLLLVVFTNDIHGQQSFKVKMCTTDSCVKVRENAVNILRYLTTYIDKTHQGYINVVAPTNDLPSGSPASFLIREKKNENYIFVTLSFFRGATLTEADVAFVLSHELCHFMAEPKDRRDEFAMDRCAFQLVKKSGYVPSGAVISVLEREGKALRKALLEAMVDSEMERGMRDPAEQYRKRNGMSESQSLSRRHFHLPDNTRHIKKRIRENKERREFLEKKLPELEGEDFILFSENSFRALQEKIPKEVK